MNKLFYIIIFLGFLSFAGKKTIAQNEKNTIDKVIAIVGDKAILLSDIESLYLQMLQEGIPETSDLKCRAFEDLLFKKLLLNQAEIDSVEVSDKEVEQQYKRRMETMLARAGGSEAELEKYFNRPMKQIREELKNSLRERMITERMRDKITEEIKVTPSEVQSYFKQIPKDSIPMIEETVEFQQIIKKPEVTEEQIEGIKEKLEGYRKRIIEHEKPARMFSVLARSYSDDEGSRAKGGELGFMPREGLVPEYANAAFSLTPNEVSNIVKTEYGYHIIQLISRRGTQVNTRHLLLKPEADYEAKAKAKEKLDSIVRLIRIDSMSFEKAALYNSDDEKTKVNDGLFVHPYTGEAKFSLSQLDPITKYTLRKLKIGEISEPFEAKNEKMQTEYKVIKLKNKIKAHKANMKNDYQIIMETALRKKQMKAFNKWLREKQNETYIKIDNSFSNCNFRNKGWLNDQ